MKQHITVDQLNELSDKGKEKLREWYDPKYTDDYKLVPNCSSYPTCCWKKDELLLPLLSIGQMIEFLDEKGLGFDIHEIVEKWEYAVVGSEHELCDALWEAVKEVLEKGGK